VPRRDSAILIVVVALVFQKHFRDVRDFSFCYLCGQVFADADERDHDHVPPEGAFRKRDREPLKLSTHVSCNNAHSGTDEKIGQLIGLRYGKRPNHRLKVSVATSGDRAAIRELNIDQAIFRWVRGFHAAPYHAPIFSDVKAALVSPFPRLDFRDGRWIEAPILPQHPLIVQVIKESRAKQRLDIIRCNKGHVLYECLWVKADNSDRHMCFFALEIEGWRDLGRIRGYEPRGCAGAYWSLSEPLPERATIYVPTSIIVPNFNPHDPYLT
jgi:hypothetical protein